MAISFNTGTTASTGVTAVLTQTVTIPAGVKAGDVIVVVFSAFRSALAGDTIQASSTGTAPVIIGTTQSITFSSSTVNAAIFYIVAAASDAGKVITGSLVSGNTAQWATALGAWSGASGTNPIDVSGATTAAGFGTSITLPTRTTIAASDWALQIAGAALGGATFTGGAGFTQREAIADAASGVAGLIYDSNASFAAGSSIGGAVFSNAAQNNWWAGFTVGLAPAPVPVIGGNQQRSGRSMLRKRLMYADV